MPYCPECHDEYRPGFTRCVDCQVSLVDELPEPPKTDEATTAREATAEPPVVVYETHDHTEADVLRSKLEFHGIPAALSGELAQRSLWNPMSPNLFGPIRISVPANQADEAREILEDVAPDSDS